MVILLKIRGTSHKDLENKICMEALLVMQVTGLDQVLVIAKTIGRRQCLVTVGNTDKMAILVMVEKVAEMSDLVLEGKDQVLPMNKTILVLPKVKQGPGRYYALHIQIFHFFLDDLFDWLA